jgi:two-component system sensor histidine kinase MtrB
VTRKPLLDPMSWGLRTRLVVAFMLLCVVTAVAVAGGSNIVARNVILQKAQDAAVLALTTRIQAMYPLPSATPDQEQLVELSDGLSSREDTGVVLYKGLSAGGLEPASVPPELRQAVRNGRVVWQRVVRGGRPALFIGTQLFVTGPDGASQASGVEVYSTRDLGSEKDSIGEINYSAWRNGAVALALAVLLASLAARGVLRPVYELDAAAHRLGEGDLRTRIEVRGSDELARVAGTFNNTAEELERLVGELRRLEADARRFVADVSHELRTPLAAMVMVTDLLDAEAPHLPTQAGQAAELVSRETHNLDRLVNDLMEISRFDSGAATLAYDHIDVATAVNATLRARGWSDLVDTELPPETTARLDPRRFDVIIANLVGNALRHGSPPVSVRLRADAEWLVVEVRDHGPGLDPEVLSHVFDRFFKADTARTRSEGSGLGLAIARENARLHQNGDLTAGNHPDGGALFVLRLPRGEPGGDR